jgi:hypothetical protein
MTNFITIAGAWSRPVMDGRLAMTRAGHDRF